MTLTREDIKWCAKECERQQSGEMSVFNLCDALYQLREYLGVHSNLGLNEPITEQDIKDLAAIVEPRKFGTGYRTTSVSFANGEVRSNQKTIYQEIKRLLEFQKEMTPEQFFMQFQTIHPFEDGNGRVGALLYNWLNLSLDNPVTAPEYDPTKVLKNTYN